MNRTELGKAFNVSLTTIDNWVRRGCPHTKEGRNLNFDLTKVLNWRSQIGGNSEGSDSVPEGCTGNGYRDFGLMGIQHFMQYLCGNLGPAFTGLLSKHTKLTANQTRAIYIATVFFIEHHFEQYLRDEEFDKGFERSANINIDAFYQEINPRAEILDFDADAFLGQSDRPDIKPVLELIADKDGYIRDPDVIEILKPFLPEGFLKKARAKSGNKNAE